MIQQESLLKAADNSGAGRAQMHPALWLRPEIRQHRRRYRGFISQGYQPGGAVKKGDVVKAVIIVRSAKGVRRNDGTHIRFDENAAVIIKDDKKPSSANSYL